jgi:hypothetical protein
VPGLPAAAGGAAFVRADRGADADASAVPAAAVPAGLVPVAGVSTAQVVGFRAAEALRVPARGVIAQVVIDVSGVTPKAPVSRAALSRLAYIAIPNVKVISFAAHASSLVARRSRLVGMRPLPEGRAPESGEPAEHKRYLLETMFTGWPVLLARSVTD